LIPVFINFGLSNRQFFYDSDGRKIEVEAMTFIFPLSCHLSGGFTEYIGCVLSKAGSKIGPIMLLEGRNLGDILMCMEGGQPRLRRWPFL